MAKDSRRLHYDWVGLKEEWLRRRCEGEDLSVAAFRAEVDARKQAAGERVCARSTWENNSSGWHGDLQARLVRIADDLAEDAVVDHVAQRRKLLKVADRLQDVVERYVDLFEADLKARQEAGAKGRPTSSGELTKLVDLLVSVRTVGAGLPKVHEVKFNDARDPADGPLPGVDRAGAADHARTLRRYLEDQKKPGGDSSVH